MIGGGCESGGSAAAGPGLSATVGDSEINTVRASLAIVFDLDMDQYAVVTFRTSPQWLLPAQAGGLMAPPLTLSLKEEASNDQAEPLDRHRAAHVLRPVRRVPGPVGAVYRAPGAIEIPALQRGQLRRHLKLAAHPVQRRVRRRQRDRRVRGQPDEPQMGRDRRDGPVV